PSSSYCSPIRPRAADAPTWRRLRRGPISPSNSQSRLGPLANLCYGTPHQNVTPELDQRDISSLQFHISPAYVEWLRSGTNQYSPDRRRRELENARSQHLE